MKPAPLKPCEMCGEPFVNKKHKDARFCSRTCSNRWIAPRRKSSRGFVVSKKGYILVRAPGHPMASKEGYLMQHRLVMANHLGRMLDPSEVVHHLNEDKADNRIDNLEVLHKRVHDRLPKPAIKPICCPHCGETIQVSGRVRKVAKA